MNHLYRVLFIACFLILPLEALAQSPGPGPHPTPPHPHPKIFPGTPAKVGSSASKAIHVSARAPSAAVGSAAGANPLLELKKKKSAE